MKLEKREITLNEKDSILDAAYSSKLLLSEYAHALTCVSRKEIREELLERIKETSEDVYLLFDLVYSQLKHNEI